MTDELQDQQEGTESEVGRTEAELDLTTLDDELLPEGHRSGFVAVVGRPNVGKSTLMNAYLSQKVAIVSPKPQTTRVRQLGILTVPDYQIVFVDTPGYHTPQHRLGEFMVEAAAGAIPDADVVLFLVDVAEPPGEEDRLLAEMIAKGHGDAPVILAMNKSDLLKPADVRPHTDAYRELIPNAAWMLVSASRGDNQDRLLEMVVDVLPEGPRYYPADQVTDARVRDLAGEVVREQILTLLRDEVPHSVAVLVNDYKERGENLVYIGATIYVERESHKGIVIGAKGSMLKSIGAAARQEMERMLDLHVYLDLWVKVWPKWRTKPGALKQLGYHLPK